MKPGPITAAEVPPEWIAEVRAIALRDGHAIRAGAGAAIEVQSINTGEFHRLMLPSGSYVFTNAAERDTVLAALSHDNISAQTRSGESPSA